MVENITIQSINKTSSRDGTKQYWKVAAVQGSYSCWKEDIVKQLSIGKTYEVEIQQSGNYKTIRAVNKEVNQGVNAPIVPPSRAFTSPTEDKVLNYVALALTSHAKDLYIELLKGTNINELTEEGLSMKMDTACKLILKAYKKFQ